MSSFLRGGQLCCYDTSCRVAGAGSRAEPSRVPPAVVVDSIVTPLFPRAALPSVWSACRSPSHARSSAANPRTRRSSGQALTLYLRRYFPCYFASTPPRRRRGEPQSEAGSRARRDTRCANSADRARCSRRDLATRPVQIVRKRASETRSTRSTRSVRILRNQDLTQSTQPGQSQQ